MIIFITFVLISLFLVAFPLFFSKFLFRKYPKSKLANFFREHIVSDVDMDEYK
jgi:hypothetical protein